MTELRLLRASCVGFGIAMLIPIGGRQEITLALFFLIVSGLVSIIEDKLRG